MFDLPWYVYAVATAIIYAAVTLMEKEQLEHEHSLEYITVLSIFTLAIMAFLWPWTNFQVGLVELAMLFLASILGSLASWWGTKGFRHLDVSIAAPLFNLSIVFTILFGFLFLGEKVTALQGLGVGILVLGSLVLTQDKVHLTPHVGHFHWNSFKKGLHINPRSPAFYQMLIVVSMIIMAITSLLSKVVVDRIDVLSLMFYAHLFGAINQVILYGIISKGFNNLIKGLDVAGPRIVWISLLYVVARIGFTKALALAPLSLVLPVQRSSSVMSTIAAGVMRREKAMMFRLAISIAMVIGVWLVVK